VQNIAEILQFMIYKNVPDTSTQGYIQLILGKFSGAQIPLRSVYEGIASPHRSPLHTYYTPAQNQMACT